MSTMFKFLLQILLVVPSFAAPGGVLAPLHGLKAHAKPVVGRYIVVLKHNTDVDRLLTSLTDSVAGNVRHTYKHAIKGFSGSFSRTEIDLIRRLPTVAYVTQDQIYHVDDEQDSAPYNLAITSENGDISTDQQTTFYYKPCASSPCSTVTAYVVDTGVYSAHPEFGGRATQAVNFVEQEDNADLYGHGTHVAGIIISNTYGVFKRGYVTGVKVCDGSGSCATEDIVAGLDWVISTASGTPSVINLSLAGPQSQPIDDAVQSAYNSGIPVVVAAGNSGTSTGACQQSPAGSSAVIAVGAIDTSHSVASFSSEDSCVDMHAPGVGVVSTWNDGSVMSLDGTSMASPHVAGVVAYFIEQFASTDPAFLLGQLNTYADQNFIAGDINGAPNVLVNNGFFKY